MQLSNYLFFTTGCEQALAFYSACGLGHVTELVRHGDRGMPVASEAMRGKIMHARFEGCRKGWTTQPHAASSPGAITTAISPACLACNGC
jgi:hypothetical protein